MKTLTFCINFTVHVFDNHYYYCIKILHSKKFNVEWPKNISSLLLLLYCTSYSVCSGLYSSANLRTISSSWGFPPSFLISSRALASSCTRVCLVWANDPACNCIIMCDGEGVSIWVGMHACHNSIY